LKETRPLWPPQRGVGLQEPNLGKTNLRVSLAYSLGICFASSLSDSFIFLTLTRLVVVFIFVNFSFALFTPPLGDYQRRSPIFLRIKKTVALPAACPSRLENGLPKPNMVRVTTMLHDKDIDFVQTTAGMALSTSPPAVYCGTRGLAS
jgi:hypothetical protein